MSAKRMANAQVELSKGILRGERKSWYGQVKKSGRLSLDTGKSTRRDRRDCAQPALTLNLDPM